MVRCWSIGVLLLFLLSPEVRAAQIVLDHDVSIYAAPNAADEPIDHFSSGDKVQYSNRSFDGFRKVRLPGDKNKFGYIQEFELSKPEAGDILPGFAIGLFGLSGKLKQGSKSFQTSDQVDYETSGYTGSIIQTGLFIDYQFELRKAVRVFVAYQVNRYTGTAVSPGLSSQDREVILEQTLTGAGIIYRYSPWKQLWLGIGAEFAHGTSVALSINGSDVKTTQDDLPNLFSVSGSLGWEFLISKHFLINPELRVADVPTAKPHIFMYSGVLSLGYRM
jgi:hypothetical protein